MKYIILLLTILLVTNLSFAQTETPELSGETKSEVRNGILYTTVTLRPQAQNKWTGEIWKAILGNYGFGGADIKAGKDLIGTVCRGWILWDISSIPANAVIQSAAILAYCKTSASLTHRLLVKKLTVDPRYATESNLFNSIGNSTVQFTNPWQAMASTGYKQISYLPEGVSALQNDLGSAYHGVGIMEADENDPIGVFRGWNWDNGNNPEPTLIITYTIPVADLVVLSASNPLSANPGESISLTCTINNIGTAGAGASKAGYYLSDGSELPYFLGESDISFLPPTGSYQVSKTVVIPSNTPPGTNYRLLFIADHLNQVNEGSYEGNNTLSKFFTVNPLTYTITVEANPSEGGTVSGGVTNIISGTADTVTAYPNATWTFVNWTEDGGVVSENPSYIFNVNGNRNLVANFMSLLPNAPTNLACQLSSSNKFINLSWSDNSTNENGFYIERKDGASGEWMQKYFADSNATSFSDFAITPGIDYYYRVRAFNTYGMSAYSNEQSVQVTGVNSFEYRDLIPDNNFLSNNYPNPFNPSTKFSFGIKNESTVSLAVYSISGQLVENIIDNRSMSPGLYTYLYSPEYLSSGMYLYVLTARNSEGIFKETRKMVFIK